MFVGRFVGGFVDLFVGRLADLGGFFGAFLSCEIITQVDEVRCCFVDDV